MGLSQSKNFEEEDISANTNSCGISEQKPQSSGKCIPVVSKKDVEYLIGKLDSFPASAQRLFSLSREYLKNGLCLDFKHNQNYIETGASSRGEGPDSGVYGFGVNYQGPQDHNIIESKIPTSKLLLHNDLDADETINTTALFTTLPEARELYQTQTFTKWKYAYLLNNINPLCFRKRSVLYIQPIDKFPEFISAYHIQIRNLNLSFFELLQGFAQIFFSGCEIVVQKPVSICESNWNIQSRIHEVTGQKQYCVNDFFPHLLSDLPADGMGNIAVVWTDIYPKDFNFVLGEASAQHRSAVISFGRFETKTFIKDAHSDINEISGELIWKIFKTLSHETCHLLNMDHCQYFSCAMNESHSVDEAMSQPLFLCPVCLRKLQQVCQFDPLERYRQLQRLLQAVIAQHQDSLCLSAALVWLDKCIDYMTSS